MHVITNISGQKYKISQHLGSSYELRMNKKITGFQMTLVVNKNGKRTVIVRVRRKDRKILWETPQMIPNVRVLFKVTPLSFDSAYVSLYWLQSKIYVSRKTCH